MVGALQGLWRPESESDFLREEDEQWAAVQIQAGWRGLTGRRYVAYVRTTAGVETPRLHRGVEEGEGVVAAEPRQRNERPFRYEPPREQRTDVQPVVAAELEGWESRQALADTIAGEVRLPPALLCLGSVARTAASRWLGQCAVGWQEAELETTFSELTVERGALAAEVRSMVDPLFVHSSNCALVVVGIALLPPHCSVSN